MDDRIFALCELSNDLLFQKIPGNRLLYYADSSLQEGYQAAAEYSGVDLEELYRIKNIKVEYRQDGKSAFGLAYRGQITLAKTGCSLVVFQSSIQALAENSQDGLYPPLDYEQARKIHLAHEFFHYLEYERQRFVPEILEPITSFRMFGLKRRARINRCSEVAAHAFAKSYLGLSVMPNYYDYLYLINTGAMSVGGMENKLAECSGMM